MCIHTFPIVMGEGLSCCITLLPIAIAYAGCDECGMSQHERTLMMQHERTLMMYTFVFQFLHSCLITENVVVSTV